MKNLLTSDCTGSGESDPPPNMLKIKNKTHINTNEFQVFQLV